MVGAPTKPARVAVPVTNPTRESERRKDGLCNSCADKAGKVELWDNVTSHAKSLQTMREHEGGFIYVDMHARNACTESSSNYSIGS